MDPNTRALLMGAAGGATEKIYVEDVFSTWLYTGNSSTQTITNGIDLSGKGGLVWIKNRINAVGHGLFDTARGADFSLATDTTGANVAGWFPSSFTGFTSTGFGLSSTSTAINSSGVDYASWTFRKAAKFFDVVTYTGNGTTNGIAHSLGVAPGFILIKRTDSISDWFAYPRYDDSGNATFPYLYKDLKLNTTNASAGNLGSLASSTILRADSTGGNINGATYVAYLFAHNAGGFGSSGNESVIKCGSYSGNGSATGQTVTLDWEPQWLLIKRTDSTGDWNLIDNMRGFVVGGADAELNPNLSAAESSGTFVTPLPTGFQLNTTDAYNASGGAYIYIAIRRGPMKTPTDATKVFDTVARSASSPNLFSTALSYVDLIIDQGRSGQPALAQTRLAGDGYLRTNATHPESATGVNPFDYNGKVYPISWGGSGTSEINWMFRRAPGFFDVVAYTGTGLARTVSHNLGVAPELMIVKRRNDISDWLVYVSSLGNNANLSIHRTDAVMTPSSQWNATTPTASVFSTGGAVAVNLSGSTYIAYLFATLTGVSKCFNYTGTGTTLQINCGFTNGARFVMIKRTDSTGDWYIWDSARGIISGNDPYLLLNSTAAEVTNTDYIDPYSAGFEISSTAPAAINANGGSYIGLAIA